MKTLFITIVLLVSVIAGLSQQKTFLRVFGLDGSKIAKGQMLGTTDSSIVLAVGKATREIKYTDISLIKTKRSFGHTVLVTGAITTVVFFTSGLAMNGATMFGFNTGYGYAKVTIHQSAGAILTESLVMGAVVGTAAGISKHKSGFKVNGHYMEWQEVKMKLDKPLEQKKAKASPQ